ncbi:MAG: Tol-Pal system protein TolB [Arcobacteraceae bacterium]
MINYFIKAMGIILFLSTHLFAVDAQMEIVKKGVTLPKISVNVASDSFDQALVNKIAKVIEQDLTVSGHFEVIENKILLPFNERPNFVLSRNQNIDLMVNLSVEQSSFAGVLLLAKVYDINSGNLVLNQSFSSSKLDRFPFLAHRTSIAINDYMKAPKIAWMDKFVIFSRYVSSKESEIVISDYTLTYQKVIVKGGLNIFPKWADASQESFYYTTYNREKPTLVKSNLFTGQMTDVISSDGMIVCSDVSSDGKKLLLTMSPENQPDVYLYNTQTKIKSKITDYKGIDVGGSFIDDESRIVFVSDRLKHPNIFAQTIGSRAVERLVFHGRNNSSATSFKNLIVYSSRDGDNEFSKDSFNLYLISTKDDFVRQLTTNGRNQFPKFSNDGESVLYLKTYNNKSSIGIIRLKYNSSFLFPLQGGNIQSIDW